MSTITRVRRAEFVRAHANGERVAIVKDPYYWLFDGDNNIGSRHEVPGKVGFTKDSVSIDDVFSDGPSRAGECFRYWVVTDSTVVAGQRK